MDSTRPTRGASALRISIRLGTSSVVRLDTPVRLPSGFARSLTRPAATGSGTTVKTIGIVDVAPFAARAATSPLAKMRSTGAFASSSAAVDRSEEHTSELQSPCNLVCRLLLEKKKKNRQRHRQ